MKLPQQCVMTVLVSGALTLGIRTGGAVAQENVDAYPSKPIIVVVPTAGTGIAGDTRVAMQGIQRAYPGSSLVLESRPGAATTIGAASVARAKPDGYTLLTVNTSFSITPSVYPNLPYDITKDFSPVTMLLQKAYVVSVHASVPVRNIKEYIAFAKAKPGELNFATGGLGSTLHVPGVLLDYMTNSKVTYVHYSKSSQRITDTLAGRTHVLVGSFGTLSPHFTAGRLRPLAVTTTKRITLAPDLPTVADVVPGYEYSSWTGIMAPAKVQPALLAKMNKMWTEAMRDPASEKSLAADGDFLVANSSQEFGQFLAADIAKWAAVVKATGLTIGSE